MIATNIFSDFVTESFRVLQSSRSSESKSGCNYKLRGDFKVGPSCVSEKQSVFTLRGLAVSLGNIAGNRHGCPTQLIYKAKLLGFWKRRRQLVNIES